MFTGLIEEVGMIESVYKSEKGAKLIIQAKQVLEDTRIGDSICTNGVCLTVTELTSNGFAVDVMAETMRKSNLIHLGRGSQINLERALRVGDRLGGHFVSGHIDGVGRIKNYEREDNAVWITVEASGELLRYVINKGSVAIDGVSLTVAYVDDTCLKVSIIPHTKEATTLIKKQIGEEVNLECDMIGKYVERLMGIKNEFAPQRRIDMKFLNDHGFL